MPAGPRHAGVWAVKDGAHGGRPAAMTQVEQGNARYGIVYPDASVSEKVAVAYKPAGFHEPMLCRCRLARQKN